MKLKNSYFYSLREAPKDEESISGILLNRAGFIKNHQLVFICFFPGFKG